MNQTKKPLVSIVIPVYNEANRLAACLRAIDVQSTVPYEVIVVDNNSTDHSAEIAQSFPFVTLLHEPRQGVVYARDRGFNAGAGEIIGRIDADTIVAPDWVAKLQGLMADQTVAAATGAVYYHDVSRPALSGRIDLFFRQWLARKLGGDVFLCGSNMTIRRSAWLEVRSQLCHQAGLHEDFDLAIHLEEARLKVIFDRQWLAGISLRRFGVSFRDLWRYMRISPQTYARHGRTSQRYMYPVIATGVVFYWFIWLNCHAYDPDSGRWSISRLRLPADIRVNPATYVD